MNQSQHPYIQSLQITGMTCASCVGRVERALRKVEGVADVTVNLATEQANIQSDMALDRHALVHAVERAGFGVHEPEQSIELNVQGMTCASCVARVERALKKLKVCRMQQLIWRLKKQWFRCSIYLMFRL